MDCQCLIDVGEEKVIISSGKLVKPKKGSSNTRAAHRVFAPGTWVGSVLAGFDIKQRTASV